MNLNIGFILGAKCPADMRRDLAHHGLRQAQGAGDLEALRREFEALYERVYGLTMPFAEVESVSWSVKASTAPDASPVVADVGEARRPAPLGMRLAYDAAMGGMVEHALFWRFDLAPGDVIDGPAVIAEDETSTMAPSNFEARVAGDGALILTRKGARP